MVMSIMEGISNSRLRFENFPCRDKLLARITVARNIPEYLQGFSFKKLFTRQQKSPFSSPSEAECSLEPKISHLFASLRSSKLESFMAKTTIFINLPIVTLAAKRLTGEHF